VSWEASRPPDPRRRIGGAVLTLYPAAVASLIVVAFVSGVRSGPLAMVTILSMHLAAAALVLVPFALRRDSWVLRLALAALAVVATIRFGGELVSLPLPLAGATGPSEAGELTTLTWNVGPPGTRNGDAVVSGVLGQDADVIALQELSPEHARAIEASAELTRRYPHRELFALPGVVGIGLVSRWPIQRAEHVADPSMIDSVVDADGRPITVIIAHPLPGRIRMAGPLPFSFDATERDVALRRVRSHIEAALGRPETVVVLGDFNVAPTEPAYRDLVDGLTDAHAEVGQGPGFTWRPRGFERLRIGLLRIDLALAGPGIAPIAAVERCQFAGDHCQLEARFRFQGITESRGLGHSAGRRPAPKVAISSV